MLVLALLTGLIQARAGLRTWLALCVAPWYLVWKAVGPAAGAGERPAPRRLLRADRAQLTCPELGAAALLAATAVCVAIIVAGDFGGGGGGVVCDLSATISNVCVAAVAEAE